jgi:hypothetical protein
MAARVGRALSRTQGTRRSWRDCVGRPLARWMDGGFVSALCRFRKASNLFCPSALLATASSRCRQYDLMWPAAIMPVTDPRLVVEPFAAWMRPRRLHAQLAALATQPRKSMPCLALVSMTDKRADAFHLKSCVRGGLYLMTANRSLDFKKTSRPETRLARRVSPKCNLGAFGQTAARATVFRFLRQPNRPNAPRPAAKSGNAAGSGVATGANSKLRVP